MTESDIKYVPFKELVKKKRYNIIMQIKKQYVKREKINITY